MKILGRIEILRVSRDYTSENRTKSAGVEITRSGLPWSGFTGCLVQANHFERFLGFHTNSNSNQTDASENTRAYRISVSDKSVETGVFFMENIFYGNLF